MTGPGGSARRCAVIRVMWRRNSISCASRAWRAVSYSADAPGKGVFARFASSAAGVSEAVMTWLLGWCAQWILHRLARRCLRSKVRASVTPRSATVQIGVQNFATRAPPRFDTKAAERAHSLQRLAATCRIFGRRGFSDGLLGHVTLRDPELHDHFWVNPVGIAMHQIKVSHLVQVDPQGQVVRGSGMVNPVGLLLHTAVHRARPEVNAVCHAHALHASTWSSFERRLDPITQDACIFFENQALILAPRVVRDA